MHTFARAGHPVIGASGVFRHPSSDFMQAYFSLTQYVSFRIEARMPDDSLDALGADLHTDSQLVEFLQTGVVHFFMHGDLLQPGHALRPASLVLDQGASVRDLVALAWARFTLVSSSSIQVRPGVAVSWSIHFPAPRTSARHLSIEEYVCEFPHG